MADIFFEGLWDSVVKDVQEVYVLDRRFLRTKVFREREKAYNTLQNNYIRYVEIINKLGECYSQIIQPQERVIIKTMLDSCVGRLLEIKADMLEFEKTDFIYMDSNLIAVKKSVLDLEVQVPEYYRTDRIEKLQELDSVIAKTLEEEAELQLNKSVVTIQQLPEGENAEDGGTDEPRKSTQSGKDDTGEQAPTDEQAPTVFDDNSAYARRSRALSRRATQEQMIKRPKFKVIEISEEEKAFMAAVRLIQRHERARIARLQTQILLEKKRLMDDIAWLRYKPIPEDVKLKVTKVIQRFWARYKMRRHQRFHTVQRNIILGLLEQSWRAGNDLRKTVEELGANRRIAQREAWQAMEDAAITARIRMEKNAGNICDSIADELRYWIYTWFKYMEAAGMPMLPAFPDAKPIVPPPSILGVPKEAPDGMAQKFLKDVVNTLAGKVLEPIGGSALIVAGHWIPVEIFALIQEQVEKSKGSAKADKKKPSKKELKAKLKKEKEQEAKRLADLKKEGFVPTPSKFNEALGSSVQEYLVDWETRVVTRKHDQNLVDLSVAMSLHLELRQQVDADMRLELQRLQVAVDLDRGKNPAPKKEPKEKKAKKKKKKKDPTGSKTEEDLVAELTKNGMMEQYKRLFFIDLPGCLSLVNYEGRNQFFEDPPPQWGDFKQVVKEYCVLHLGSNMTHVKAPLIRSVLICGPQQLIRDYADVICTESGAVRFVLDPLKKPTTVYKKKMFKHMFSKVPRLLKPAIILIPGAEKMFYKNVPKEEREFNPKALAKIIPKMVKEIKPGDQILILGLSDQPWVATAGPMVKMFDKVICFPDMDYQTLNRFWSEKILKYHGVDRYFNTNVLSTMTKGYSLSVLEQKLADIMTPERIISLKYKPLMVSELCLDLPKIDEKAALMNSWDWSQKSVKMYIQRRNKLALAAEKRAKENKGGDKAKPKDKKKKKEPLNKETIDNCLLSRSINRNVTGCVPWSPQRQLDALVEEQKLYDPIVEPKIYKHDLYKNEKSLDDFPISKRLP